MIDCNQRINYGHGSHLASSLPQSDDSSVSQAPVIAATLDGADSPLNFKTLDDVKSLATNLGELCQVAVRGREDVIELVLIAMLADGHVLLEDHPGSGKTTLAKALGSAIKADRSNSPISAFRRIQFTPDLLPSDVTGTTVFDAKTNEFRFHPGPIFGNILLGDEINRTSPKVQAALLEAMAEKQVTVDNQTYPLNQLFFVLATQNPLDLNGTYPLPVAQLDRFLFKVKMNHLSRESELLILSERGSRRKASQIAQFSPTAIVAARNVIRDQVHIAPAVHECLVDISHAMRADQRVAQGVSTRCLVLAVDALKSRAALHGRDFVSPRDVKSLAIPLFSHRLQLKSGGLDADQVVNDCSLPVIEAAIRKSLK